ncbi:putative ent-copalyl diphosphate synthase [Lupinus albus]|uniref:Putative ent-copalyl diphosphate synthase n=1 Tax=Lupinus albus TaxID=3870 RepID=A0A6A4NEI0_LUPAL|nr:putative ent-copalyl diphosphate synthase [Lupinus albus]
MFYQYSLGKHIMSSHFSTHYHFPSLFSSSSSNHFTFPLPPSPSFFLHSFSSSKSSIGALSSETKHKQDFRCRAISKSRTREYPDLLEGGLATLKLHEIDVEDDKEQDLNEITVSAYDTAWVALVEDVNGSGAPQFPSTLEWIAKNQNPDGSWGDSEIFIAHDRIINTLACVVALRSWNLHPEKCEKGMVFFKENLSKIQNENAEHMPVGFEVAFPSLLDVARSLNIEVPHDSHILNDILEKRNVKLARIPREMMHKVPTTLLHSLEGMSNLDWKQLLKLQCEDGSFLFSPSSTAFALINTKDEKCLKYLNKAVNKFNGGVPNVYPVDLFEHIWLVDRLDRLGISRYFQHEIKDCMNYVYRYWSEKGICWARNTNVEDIDDTSMGFRLLRLHGHHVSANVFKQFERNGEFFCFGGQSTQAVTGMYNLYRASQVMFPGEEILDHAKQFSAMFLREKQAANELLDKWIIMKNLPHEVAYALDVPWYANLPRLETRFYIDQYGGENDVWIGKTLYRMPYVNNKNYLELAKLDYNNCQALHLTEWGRIQEWYSESRLGEFGLSRKRLLLAYFLVAANIFEPERSHERLAWAKTTALLEIITTYLSDDAEMRKAFVINFSDLLFNMQEHSTSWRNKTGHALAETLVSTIDQISSDILVSHGLEIQYDMHHTWKKWLLSWQSEVDKCVGEAELLVQIINLSSGHWISKEQLFHPQYKRLLQLTNTICHRLHCYQKDKELENGSYARSIYNITTPEIESEMQELVQLVFQKSPAGIDFNIKKTFLTVAKNFYYAAFFDSRTIDFHIDKVLFDKVV